ncbi:MAG: tRNA (adenosine(37)-N6)-threonylcarbamoyltransferase complex dimerization subunit type 1 TsaB [Phycisphaerae bacterium]|nr:tRNA (adenosine(37)-N6)-threonylcarbamoyltransferase complex dimerization subunit type 1 TsaB [Phycisphaerae bacterium]
MTDLLPNSLPNQPRIVAIETSGRIGSVAVGLGPQFLAERQFTAGMNHAIELMPTLRDLTVAQGWQPRQIQHVYLSIGPGSFTGLRIAVMVARSLAQAIGCLVVAVPTLDVLTQNAPAEARHLAVILDAKRGHVYAARYCRGASAAAGAGGWHCTAGPILTSPEEFVRQSPKPLYVLGEGVDYHRPALRAGVDDDADLIELGRESWVARAAAVHELGWAMAGRGIFADVGSLVPLYIRLPEAQELWNRRHASPGSSA